MVARPDFPNHRDVLQHHETSLNTTIRRYRSAVEKLMKAYLDKRPAAIVVGAGRLGPAHVIAKFLELTADDAETVTFAGPCSNATDFMRRIVRSIGFDPDRLSLNDLESVLDLFLQHQRKTRRRTIIAVQEFDAQGWWVLDKIRRLIESEVEEKYGLTLLLSGPPRVNEVLDEPVLDVISDYAGERVVLMPFTSSETRDFIRSYVMSSVMTESGREDIGEIIDFDATNLIHEFCQGIPDDVYRVCCKCLELQGASGEKRISTGIVKEAVTLLGLVDPVEEEEDEKEFADESVDGVSRGYLVVEVQGEPAQQIPLGHGNVVVGRDQLCDHCIPGLLVSRFHSLFSSTAEGVVVADLGSTNGTFVNGGKIERHTLDRDDVVGVGHARIRYIPGSGEPAADADREDRDAPGGSEKPDTQPCINYVGSNFKLVSAS
jgi:type II secretory pathway predicted ATPase ExeA